jgi:hypothetical protein
MLTTMLFQRARIHGDSIAILNGALAELKEEWRITAGGENGGATDTDLLLRMVDRAAKLVSDSEDAVQRTMKLALEEQKAAHQYADSLGPALYQGTGEKLDMPAGLPSSDRETMRNLLALIGKAANDAGTIETTGTPVQTMTKETVGRSVQTMTKGTQSTPVQTMRAAAPPGGPPPSPVRARKGARLVQGNDAESAKRSGSASDPPAQKRVRASRKPGATPSTPRGPAGGKR